LLQEGWARREACPHCEAEIEVRLEVQAAVTARLKLRFATAEAFESWLKASGFTVEEFERLVGAGNSVAVERACGSRLTGRVSGRGGSFSGCGFVVAVLVAAASAGVGRSAVSFGA
jgi:hypothetical protein